MSTLPLENEFKSFAGDPVSAVEGALLVSRIIRPDTDSNWCRRELRRLADCAGPAATPENLVESLRAQGFAGADQYYEVDNSALEFVLRRRRGIPITLAMVLVGAGECLRMSAVGVNFPGHFMASLMGQLVDPFTMTLIDAAGRRAWLAGASIPADEAFKPATPADVVSRMLNNLRALATSQGDHAYALRLTDYQLFVSPTALPIHIDRADHWMALGAIEMVKRELEQAILLTASDTLKAKLEEKLRQLAPIRPTLH